MTPTSYSAGLGSRETGARAAEWEVGFPWQRALEAGGLGVWDWEVASGRVRFAGGWQAMLGLQRDEDARAVWSSHLHRADRARVEADIRAFLDDSSGSYFSEYRLRRPDGRYTWIQSRGQVVERAADGRPRRVVGTHADIEARKRVEAELEQSQRRFAAVFDTMFQFTGLMSVDGMLIETNQASLSVIGKELSDVTGIPFHDTPFFRHSERIRKLIRSAVKRAREGEVVRERITICDAAGRVIPLEFLLRGAYDHSGRLIYLIPEGRDISETVAAERALRESEHRFEMTFAYAPIGLALVSPEGHMLEVNNELCRMLGYSRDELLALTFPDFTHPDDLSADLAQVNELLAGRGDSYQMEKRYRHKRGHIIHAHLAVTLLRDGEGRPSYFIGQAQDISERKAHEAALSEAKELAQVTLASIGEGMIRVDRRGKITLVNQAACDLLGIDESALLGTPFDRSVRLFDPDEPDQVPDPVTEVLASGMHATAGGFRRLQCADGYLLPISESVSPVRDAAGTIIGAVFVFRDVSDVQAMADELDYLARHDTLTGLPNRRAFEADLERAWARARAQTFRGYLLYLDLDQFKAINDACGHLAGDALLRDIASLLKQQLRSDDILARIGGDEFAALIEVATGHELQSVAEKLIAAVSGYEFRYGGRVFGVGLSIGAAPVDGSAGSHRDLLAQADTALYAAKEGGRGTLCRFAHGDALIEQMRTSLDVGQRVRYALDHDAFVLYLQKIVDVEGTVAGYEVLLRLAGSEGLVTPDVFLPAARKLGLLARIDYWTVATALEMVQRLRRQRRWPERAFISINLSAWNLRDRDFVKQLAALAHGSGVPADLIRFEVTETEDLGEVARPELISELRQLGYRVWVDDFGTGYNSWDMLKRFEVDGIKIDGSFVRDLERDRIGEVMVAAITDLGWDKDWEIVAEGVEDSALIQKLAGKGVPLFQGYACHRPEAADAVLERRARPDHGPH